MQAARKIDACKKQLFTVICNRHAQKPSLAHMVIEQQVKAREVDDAHATVALQSTDAGIPAEGPAADQAVERLLVFLPDEADSEEAE